jgi:hypothetical protein
MAHVAFLKKIPAWHFIFERFIYCPLGVPGWYLQYYENTAHQKWRKAKETYICKVILR